MKEDNDASSNPNADEHLPAAGEFDAANVPQGGLHTTADDGDLEDPNDMNEISAKRTDDIEEAPDPDGPANPTATNG